eukprot:CFRG6343T1
MAAFSELDSIFPGNDTRRSSASSSFDPSSMGVNLWVADSSQEKMHNIAMMSAFCICAGVLFICAWLGGHVVRNLLLAVPLVCSTFSHITL